MSNLQQNFSNFADYWRVFVTPFHLRRKMAPSVHAKIATPGCSPIYFYYRDRIWIGRTNAPLHPSNLQPESNSRQRCNKSPRAALS